MLNRYEEGLRKTLIDFLTKEGMMDGRLLEVEELNEKWKTSAPSYMVDAVPEVAKYPLVAIAWATTMLRSTPRWLAKRETENETREASITLFLPFYFLPFYI